MSGAIENSRALAPLQSHTLPGCGQRSRSRGSKLGRQVVQHALGILVALKHGYHPTGMIRSCAAKLCRKVEKLIGFIVAIVIKVSARKSLD